jgi:aspartyl-tRNA(Asn)/glutamyl-tRNA(Gln) amidotransferase subunit A
LALVLGVLAGVDPQDSTSIDDPPPDYAALLAAAPLDLQGVRIGVPAEYFAAAGMDKEVAELVRAAVAELERLGAEIATVSLPHTRYAIAAYYLIANAEASSNLARYDGVKYGTRIKAADLDEMYVATRTAGFGDEAQLRILLGTFCLSSGYYEAYYLKASKVRAKIRADFERAFADCDVLACATSPFAAFRLGEKLDDPLQMYLCDALTVPASLAGLPPLSMPCGLTAQGLPVGLQLAAPALREDLLLQTAHVFQTATDWHLRRPAP